MKILILGDSFSADWKIKYTESEGWPNFLAKVHEVDNIAQAGCSEYKIYLQLKSCQKNLRIYDQIIISHTSPYRIPTALHPVHHGDLLHHSADLIFSDIEYHYGSILKKFNRSLKSAYDFFKYHADDRYQEIVYCLLREKINEIIADIPTIVIDHPLVPKRFLTERDIITVDNISNTDDNINHLTTQDNINLYLKILDKINEIHCRGI